MRAFVIGYIEGVLTVVTLILIDLMFTGCEGLAEGLIAAPWEIAGGVHESIVEHRQLYYASSRWVSQYRQFEGLFADTISADRRIVRNRDGSYRVPYACFEHFDAMRNKAECGA